MDKLVLFLFLFLIIDNGYFSSSNYDANYLDDPNLTELTAGKNRTCLKFASYSVRIN